MKNKHLKTFWIIILILNFVIFFILMMPGMEVYFRIDMPFIQIDNTTFNIFGYIEPDPKKQIAIMMFSGIFMMLPGRFIFLAWIKINEINRKIKTIH